MMQITVQHVLLAAVLTTLCFSSGRGDSPFVTGDDANAILQAAFAQAGVDLSPSSTTNEDQMSPSLSSSSSSSPVDQSTSYSTRPTLSERLRSTLRFVRRPSFLLRRHRLFPQNQLLIPIIASPGSTPQMPMNQMSHMTHHQVYSDQQQRQQQQSHHHHHHQQQQQPQQHQQANLLQMTDRKSSNGIESIRLTPRSPIPLSRGPVRDYSTKSSSKSSKIISSGGASKSKSRETWIPTNHMSVGAATVNGFKPIINGYSPYTMSNGGISSVDSLNSSSSSISPSLLEAKEWKQITTPLVNVESSKSSIDKLAAASNSKIVVASSPSALPLQSNAGAAFRKENQLIDVNEVDRSVAESSSNELTHFTSMPLSTGDILAEMSKVIATSATASTVRGKSECTHKNLGWCEFSSDSYPEAFVSSVVKECRDTIDRMYVEVPQNLASLDDFVPFSPVPSHQGTLSRVNSSSITSASSSSSPSSSSLNSTTTSGRGGQGSSWSWAGYKQSVTLCDSSRKYIRPSVAQDITGRWFVIVQSNLYHQSIPVELCKAPGSVCNGLGECGVSARCVQRHSQHLLISIDLDKEHDCPSMRLYRFPSGCVCDHATYY